MTAKDVLEKAMMLLDTDPLNIPSENKGKAPFLIDQLQRELARIEGVAAVSAITSLDDVLAVSDDAAVLAMTVGLAAKFALIDKDADLYNEYTMQYENAKRKTYRATEEDVIDTMNTLGGMCDV